jgi:hypothetical protein
MKYLRRLGPTYALGERGHTPERGAPYQHLAGEGPAREAEMCPTGVADVFIAVECGENFSPPPPRFLDEGCDLRIQVTTSHRGLRGSMTRLGNTFSPSPRNSRSASSHKRASLRRGTPRYGLGPIDQWDHLHTDRPTLRNDTSSTDCLRSLSA